jgi:hypothetical protein
MDLRELKDSEFEGVCDYGGPTRFGHALQELFPEMLGLVEACKRNDGCGEAWDIKQAIEAFDEKLSSL